MKIKPARSWEVVVELDPGPNGERRFARLESKGRSEWKTKATAVKHARDVQRNHRRKAWAQPAS